MLSGFVFFLANYALVHTDKSSDTSKQICISQLAHSFVFAASVLQGGLSPRTRAASYLQRAFELGKVLSLMTA